jgi:IS5 family transposase
MKQQTLAAAADQGAGFDQYRRPTKHDVFLVNGDDPFPPKG